MKGNLKKPSTRKSKFAMQACAFPQEKRVGFTLGRQNTIPLSLLLEGSVLIPPSESVPPSQPSPRDPQHNKPPVHLEPHITSDTNNNLSLFLQCKITGSRLVRAQNQHFCFPGRAVNYWALPGKRKDHKAASAYNI